MVSLDLRSCSPISAIFTSSMVISPAAASSNRKRQRVMEDFPAPVRPTMPIWTEKQTRTCLVKLSSLPSIINRFVTASPPSLLLWRLTSGSSGRGRVPPGSEHCSPGTARSPAWAIQVGAACPPPPRGPVNEKLSEQLNWLFCVFENAKPSFDHWDTNKGVYCNTSHGQGASVMAAQKVHRVQLV